MKQSTQATFEETQFDLEIARNILKRDYNKHALYYTRQAATSNYLQFIQAFEDRLKSEIKEKLVDDVLIHCADFDAFIKSYHKHIVLYEVAQCHTYRLEKNGIDYGLVRFTPHSSYDIKLSRIQIDSHYQNLGLGSNLMKQMQLALKQTNNGRLLLLPCPPVSEQCINIRAAILQLKKWYLRLGFIFAKPECIEVTEVKKNRNTKIGLCDLMVCK